jgi:flagellar protein FlaG
MERGRALLPSFFFKKEMLFTKECNMGIEIPHQTQLNIPQDHILKDRSEDRSNHLTNPPQQAPKIQTPTPLQNKEEIEEILNNLEKTISQFNRRFEFIVDKSIDRLIIKIIDKQTDKVIKEIPPEEIQHLLVKLKEMVGFLTDQTI